jgi:SAM-dependent methyltransferase
MYGGTRTMPFYGPDLAHIHDVGFRGFIEGVAPGVLHELHRAGIDQGRVVDVGCGGGQWAQRLTRAGFQVQGIDLSPAMIRLARRRCPESEFTVASVWGYRFPRCRAVTALGEVFCYRAERTGNACRLSNLLRRIFVALEAGGLLVFDVAEVGLDRRRQTTVVERPDWTCLVRYEYDEQYDRLTRHITTFRRQGRMYRRATERHVIQLYRSRDVAAWLREAGFRVRTVRRFGQHPLLPQRVGFVARKG